MFDRLLFLVTRQEVLVLGLGGSSCVIRSDVMLMRSRDVYSLLLLNLAMDLFLEERSNIILGAIHSTLIELCSSDTPIDEWCSMNCVSYLF